MGNGYHWTKRTCFFSWKSICRGSFSWLYWNDILYVRSKAVWFQQLVLEDSIPKGVERQYHEKLKNVRHDIAKEELIAKSLVYDYWTAKNVVGSKAEVLLRRHVVFWENYEPFKVYFPKMSFLRLLSIVLCLILNSRLYLVSASRIFCLSSRRLPRWNLICIQSSTVQKTLTKFKVAFTNFFPISSPCIINSSSSLIRVDILKWELSCLSQVSSLTSYCSSCNNFMMRIIHS